MSTFALRTMRIQPLPYHSFHATPLPLSSQRPLFRLATSLLLQNRYASSSTTTATTIASLPRHKVNGPVSTLPPPLSLPERKSDQRFFPSYAISLGKAYATFYKNGIKSIYTNFMACRPIQAELDNKYHGSLSKSIDDGSLDRSRFQLLTRSWFDIKRVPIFALVFLICGEFTPFVVIAVPSVVPYTCRIPRQIESDRKSLEKRRAISFQNLTAGLPKGSAQADDLNRMQLLHISWSLGLSSSVWDWLGGQLPGLPTPFLRRKVKRRVTYLHMDDKLIQRDGGVDKMDREEIKMALVDRGIDVLGQSDVQIKNLLKVWLQAREQEESVIRLLLTRPSLWLSLK